MMKHPAIPDHLWSACAERLSDAQICPGCDDAVKIGPKGRYFITMGHPGFNDRRNNGNGYPSQREARAVLASYQTVKNPSDSKENGTSIPRHGEPDRGDDGRVIRQ